MVYFGERRFRRARPGISSREKARIFVPAFLLLFLVVLIISREWSGPDRSGVPVRAARSPEAAVPATPSAGPDVPLPAGGNIAPPQAIPVVDPNAPPAPFDPDAPSPLASVRDSEIPTPGAPELAGQIHLFHRIRAGVDVPVAADPVPWDEITARAPEIRGRRHRFLLTLIEEPIPRTLPENPSGVVRYWEVWGRDEEGHFTRLDFIEKPKILPADSVVEVVGDFLRLHRYQPQVGGEAAVPQYLAGEVTIVEEPPPAPTDWSPLLWAGGISLLALVPLLWGLARDSGSPGTRRRRAARPPSGDEPVSPSAG